jgi:hypothetical protein
MGKFLIPSLILIATTMCRLGGPLDLHFSQNHPLPPQPVSATVEGEVDYCFVGGVIGHTKRVPVRIYTMQQSKEIRAVLDRMHSSQGYNSQAAIEQLNKLDGELETAVRRARTFLPLATTDDRGRFRFTNVPAGQSYFLFVILFQEDGTDWASRLLPDLKPGMEPIKLVFDEEVCVPKT